MHSYNCISTYQILSNTYQIFIYKYKSNICKSLKRTVVNLGHSMLQAPECSNGSVISKCCSHISKTIYTMRVEFFLLMCFVSVVLRTLFSSNSRKLIVFIWILLTNCGAVSPPCGKNWERGGYKSYKCLCLRLVVPCPMLTNIISGIIRTSQFAVCFMTTIRQCVGYDSVNYENIEIASQRKKNEKRLKTETDKSCSLYNVSVLSRRAADSAGSAACGSKRKTFSRYIHKFRYSIFTHSL